MKKAQIGMKKNYQLKKNILIASDRYFFLNNKVFALKICTSVKNGVK